MTSTSFSRSVTCLTAITVLFFAARAHAAQKRVSRDGATNARTSNRDEAAAEETTDRRTSNGASERDTKRVQQIVEAFKSRLSIPDDVVIALVPKNPLVVSVTRMADRTFELSLETGFLHLLTDDELDSVVAHELGHVWIFTHHPFLQTEELANQIAMQIVTRESLVRVYDKVWERTGIKSTVAYLPGK